MPHVRVGFVDYINIITILYVCNSVLRGLTPGVADTKVSYMCVLTQGNWGFIYCEK